MMIMAVMIMVGHMIIDSDGSEDDDGRTGLPTMNIVLR